MHISITIPEVYIHEDSNSKDVFNCLHNCGFLLEYKSTVYTNVFLEYLNVWTTMMGDIIGTGILRVHAKTNEKHRD